MRGIQVQVPQTDNINELRAAFFSLLDEVGKVDHELGEKTRLLKVQSEQLKESADFKTAFISIMEDLDETLRQRTSELELANQRLLELDKVKDEFLSIASHELRTPMTAIKGYVDMVLSGDAGSINEKVEEFLQEVGIAVGRQIRLVNDLLDLSRIETGRMSLNLGEVRLEEIVKQVIKGLTPVVKEKGLRLYFKEPEGRKKLSKVWVDPDKVTQILNNLLGNALKFTEKGEIVVKISSRGDKLVVFVSDTGDGIVEKFHSQLFQKFHRITTKDYTAKGTGLGLYISKKLAQMMGGDVWLVKSEVGKGSTFGFSLPIAENN